MVILQLDDSLFDYLGYVVKQHANSGIDPEEGLATYQLWQALKTAQRIDPKAIAGASGPIEAQTEAPTETSNG